jgi:Fur family ferric uptake transcriptional regulator
MDPERRTLHDLGLAATAPRLSILRSLRRAARPRSATEIYTDILTEGGATGLTTVYRTLTALVDADLVHGFDRHGETVYRLCGDRRHQHLVCRGCGLVVETDLALDEALRDHPAAAGFRVEEVHGTCGSCRPEEPAGDREDRQPPGGRHASADIATSRQTTEE